MALDYQKEGRIAIFTINRPEAMNSLNLQVRTELYDALVDFRDNNDLWVGIITGAGEKAFSAGYDIKEMGPAEGAQAKTVPTIMRGLEVFKPLIAAINGYCLGGGLEMALACDLRIAAQHARFGLSEVARGLMPAAGGTQRLPRMVPWCKAAEIMLLGRQTDAQEAYRIGLVNTVVPSDKLMSTAREWADAICKVAPLSTRAIKEAMIKGHSMTLEAGLELEMSIFKRLKTSEDYTEGVRAFVEKRNPVYRGR